MDNFDNLKNAWKGQTPDSLPDIETVKANIKKTRKQLIMKNIIAIILLTCTIIVLLMIITFIEFEFLSTKIAIIGTVLTIALAIVFIVKLFNRIYKADELQYSSKKYLQELKKFKIEQNSVQSKGMTVYFISITFFIYLYFYEIYLMNPTIGIIAYVSTTAWILFSWLYLRPKQIAKQESQINELIREVERIEAQLGE